MPKATEQLLKDHKMIRKVLADFKIDNPRYPELLKTLQRIVLGHAWFEDEIFLPAFKAEPLLHRKFVDEIIQEHHDIDFFLTLLRKSPVKSKESDFGTVQLTTLLETHFKKEEDGLFPLAERILDSEGLNELARVMEQRKTEVRAILPGGSDE